MTCAMGNLTPVWASQAVRLLFGARTHPLWHGRSELGRSGSRLTEPQHRHPMLASPVSVRITTYTVDVYSPLIASFKPPTAF